jgi:predicted alpha-1,2-mannosidase
MRRRWLRTRSPMAVWSPVRIGLAAASTVALTVTFALAAPPAFAGPEMAAKPTTAKPKPAKPKAALVADPASMVNTIVQTGIGDDFPGAQAPFGMIQWSPNTNSRSAGGNYDHGDNQLRGYALTNLAGPGCGAMGDDPIMPMIGGAPGNVNGTMVSYDHSSEIATAGYFSAKSSGGQVRTELTATQRSGMARITYPSSTQAAILVKLRDSQNQESNDPSSARIVSNTEVIGNTTSGHFCGDSATYVLHFDLVFDRPFTSSQILGGNQGIFLTFDTTSSQVVQAKVGMSFVSDANAKQNWQTENPNWSFDTVRAATHDAWNRYLGKIEVGGGTNDQRVVFYSNLYHQLNHPNVVSDVNGQYRGYDNQTHTVAAGQGAHYENFSGWDIYHNQASLAALLAPRETGDMATSLKQAFDQSGAIPQWGFMNSFNGVMIGDSAPAIVAEYHAFGARSVDDNALLADLIHQATVDNRIRSGLAEYDRLGYKPDDQSLTIEWTQEDFALSRLALALGDTQHADFFTKRSLYWKNIFDPQTGLLSPRHSNGAFVHETPSSGDGYVEGTAAQYRFQVPSDQPALAAMLGGSDATTTLLDNLFQSFDGSSPTQAFLTNEFSLGQQWFYNWIGKPWRTQEVMHRWLATTYANDCCTFPNNDDLGTMSAQYVWATMGIYPENLGTTDVTLNAPLFTQVLIHLDNGNTITINAPQASNSNYYIQSLKVNGSSSTKTWLPGSIFTTGGTVDFTLGANPSSWGSGANDAPPSYDGPGGGGPPPPPSDNLALNKPATGSTPCNSNEGPAKAVNGSVSGGNSDKWCSSAAGLFLQVDLGSSTAISSFTVRHASAGGESASFNTRDFDIQVSDDGTNFTTVVQARGNTDGVTTHPVNTTGRYVRLNVLTPTQTSDNHARIYELEVYGDGGGGEPPPTGNLALNRPATGSAPCNDSETPDKAVNGSVSGGNSDKFCTGDATRFLQVDLGSAVHIGSFTVRHAEAGGEFSGWNTQDFDIQTSTDGTNFTTVAQIRGNTAAVSNNTVDTTARYIRLNIITAEQGNPAGAARIYEFEAYA